MKTKILLGGFFILSLVALLIVCSDPVMQFSGRRPPYLQPIQYFSHKKIKWALVFSAEGIRGVAHIGVI